MQNDATRSRKPSLPPAVKIDCLTSTVNRHGKRYYYFRYEDNPKIAISGDPSQPSFMVTYHALLRAAKDGKLGTAAATYLPGSVGNIIVQYKLCSIKTDKFKGFLALADSSQLNYRRALDLIHQKAGFHLMRDVTPSGIKDFRNKLVEEKVAPSKIDECLMVWSVLWLFASEFYAPRQDLSVNPTTGVLRVKPRTVHHKRWPLHVIARVYDAANKVIKLAIYLLLYTGQREIDVAKMKWDDVATRNGVRMIHVMQQKTGTKVWIPLHPILGALLDETPHINDYILNTLRREPFASTSSLSNTIKSTLKKSRINDWSSYTAHGLRAAAACELLEAGNDVMLVASITGHKDLKVLMAYLAEINQEKLAIKAMATWAAVPPIAPQ